MRLEQAFAEIDRAYVSIHAPREGCDIKARVEIENYQLFQFTHPGRGATTGGSSNTSASSRFNSRTPGGVRRPTHPVILSVRAVSIHAPREGCDGDVELGQTVALVVSIHAPREGCDYAARSHKGDRLSFQFTHPGRGATKTLAYICVVERFQFTHPGRGATPKSLRRGRRRKSFNSRTPGGVRRFPGFL